MKVGFQCSLLTSQSFLTYVPCYFLLAYSDSIYYTLLLILLPTTVSSKSRSATFVYILGFDLVPLRQSMADLSSEKDNLHLIHATTQLFG